MKSTNPSAKGQATSTGADAEPALAEPDSRDELREANEALVLAGLREQELAERATRLFEEAQRATRAREEILAIVSHDLRNPLGVILTSLDMLGPLPEGEGLQPVRETLARIRRSAERMNRLIGDLLDAASADAGGLTIDARPTPIATLVTDTIDSHEPIAAAKSIRIVGEVAPGLPDVMVDPMRIHQVLANLLGNALKFTPHGGVVTVSLAESADRHEVRCVVKDTGAGISREELSHVFERFWQAPRHAKLGSGLGLYIVRAIVEAHGGKVFAESEPGSGSAFAFTVPVIAARRV